MATTTTKADSASGQKTINYGVELVGRMERLREARGFATFSEYVRALAIEDLERHEARLTPEEAEAPASAGVEG